MIANEALEAAVDTVAQILHVRIGLRPDASLRGRLVRAVRDEAAHLRHDPAAYVDRLSDDHEALQRLLNRVTVQETGFFRHPEQFEVLVSDVIPALRPPVRIWSAGCANGQEAYSLAMVLEEHGIDGSVVATDISTAALARTAEARYTSRELSGVSPDRLARHFSRRGGHWEVNAALRDRVTTLQHNLLDPIPSETMSCEVVLCRNVLIYLSPDQIRAFLDRVSDTLPPTTTFLLGAAETIWQVSDRFTATHIGETFVYRRPRSTPLSPSPGTRPEQLTPRTVARTSRWVDRGPRSSRAHPAARVRLSSDRGPDPRTEESADVLEKLAQGAVAKGDYELAVVAFRKCAYLKPHDPVAQLHLGLALEAAGDVAAARRAFSVARRALAEAGPDVSPSGLEGYAPSELLRLLESKQ